MVGNFVELSTLRILKERRPFRRTGQYTIGHIGWFGVLRLHFSLEVFRVEEQFVRLF